MSTTYVACIADIVASRTLAPARRESLQQRLHVAASALNRDRRWHDSLAARFALTAGDELQGLLTGARGIWALSHALRAEFPDVTWIFACGRGTLTTRLTPARAAPELDGPCFHAARAALDAAKRRRRVFAFGGFPADLEGLAGYYSALYWSWTPRQRVTAALLRLYTPEQVAGRLEIDRSAVSHLSRRMGWPHAVAGDSVFKTMLEAL
jgi:hypothetical protein